MLLDYAGTRFLIDPMLSAKGAFPGFEGTANSQLRNPLVELPLPIDELVDVDAVIVTHDHPDHWDDAARALIPKHLPLLVQHQKDADAIRASGFEDVRLLSDQPEFAGIRLQQTGGQHGSDPLMAVLGERMGEVCGVVFSHPDEQSLYLAGDTIWHPRSNKPCNSINPRSSSSTAAMHRCPDSVPSSWARRMSPPFIRLHRKPR